MNRLMQIFSFLLLASIAGCQKKAYEKYYEDTNGLEPPIYQQLQAAKHFTSLLSLIDKSGYRTTLDAAGYWTFFAPNDEAFKTFLMEKGISGVDKIDSASARAMVQYLLVYNSFKKDRLDDYQATLNNAGWTPDAAFRRRTAYYTGFYNDTNINNKPIVAIASNRNNLANSLTGNYIADDDNNKYITYFTDTYFSSHGLSATDYNYFYPNSEYKGFNVAQAKVVSQDIVAGNGIIHEIDKVISPLMSIDEYIRTRPEYSSFKAILNRLYTNNTIQFIYNAAASHRYQVLRGRNDSVFVKAYSSRLAFSPNNENSYKLEDNDGQKDCWTMFIPNNAAVDAYVKNVLCEYYPSLDVMPIEIIIDFLNAHMFATAVWPTKFSVTRNNLSEPARFDAVADVFDRKILSNGMVYGTTKVQASDIFSTVYAKAYLNPQYTMMTKLLDVSGLRLLVSKSNIPVNMFLISDKTFLDSGYYYNASKSQFEYKPATATAATTNGVNDRLQRILRTCVFFDPFKQKIENLSGSDIVKSGDAGTEGDYIRFNNNTVVSSGLLDFNKSARVDSSKTAANGKVYYINNILFGSEKGLGLNLQRLGATTASDYNSFWQYLSNSNTYNATTAEINGLTGFTTIFVPTNAAIKQAVNDGLLPGTGTAPNKNPNFSPTSEPDKEQVRRFLSYHILAGNSIIPDGNNTGGFNSFLKNASGTSLRFTVNNTPGAISIVDNFSRTSKVIVASSNNLGNRSVIHLIDNYLKYNYN